MSKRTIGGLYSSSIRYNWGRAAMCYYVAYQVASHLHRMKRKEIAVCHGVVTGSESADVEIAGKRYSHAWAEFTLIDGLVFCVEASNPDKATLVLPAELFYRIGDIDSRCVRRYSVMQATELALRTRHSGPFEPPLEPCVDWDSEKGCWLP